MEMNHIFIDPFYAALFGWLAFNVIMFSMEKDGADQLNVEFSPLQYFYKKWDNWLASLICVPIVLYLGYHNLNIGMIDIESPKWAYLYYLGAGFLPELVIAWYKKWKLKNKSDNE